MIHIIKLSLEHVPFAIAAHLIETEAGPILLETGPHSTLPVLEAGLAKLGYKMEDIQHVFLTHIHLDHAGAAWAFAEKGATIYMHPFGKKHMVADDVGVLHSSVPWIKSRAGSSGHLPLKRGELLSV